LSAHFNVNEIGFFSLEQWPVKVCAWRGCCIEVFARAEHSFSDCLRHLGQAGIVLGKDARSHAAVTRLRGLRGILHRYDLGGHGKVAERRLDAWERIYETRAYLAHGQTRARPDGIVIDLLTFDRKTEKRMPPKHISQMNMLKALAEIEQAQRLMHQQLGHIRTLAPAAKPLTP